MLVEVNATIIHVFPTTLNGQLRILDQSNQRYKSKTHVAVYKSTNKKRVTFTWLWIIETVLKNKFKREGKKKKKKRIKVKPTEFGQSSSATNQLLSWKAFKSNEISSYKTVDSTKESTLTSLLMNTLSEPHIFTSKEHLWWHFCIMPLLFWSSVGY